MKAARVWALRLLGVTVLLSFLGVGVYAGLVTRGTQQALEGVERQNLLPTAGASPTESSEPQAAPSAVEDATASSGPLNILLLGVDARPAQGDGGRSDSIMVAHIPADRSEVYLISLPRDTYASIPGHTPQKLNAAYSLGGAPLTAQTVQELLGITIDHVALVDFKGFMRVVETLGGVTVTNPYSVYDDSQGISFAKGRLDLDRDTALKYVRSRHGWPHGDLDRAANQQRVLKAIAGKLMSAGTLTDPLKLTSSLQELGKHVTVDQKLTPDTMKSILLSLRFTSPEGVKSFTLPVATFENKGPSVGDVDILDVGKMDILKAALQGDTLSSIYSSFAKPTAAGGTS